MVQAYDDKESEQRAVCTRVGAPYFPAPGWLKIGVSANVRSGEWPLNLLRHPPKGDTSGWYIWAGQTFSNAPDFFAPLHVEHLQGCRPEVLRYLGLPPGWRVLLGRDGYEDIWFDEALLNPHQAN
ncbi:MAG: immunity protein Imm33 domain-containing protein [Propylenella sp.]